MMTARRSFSTLLLLVILALATGWGLRGSSQTPPPAGLLIAGGTLIDVTSGWLVPNTNILMEGERIKAVGSAGRVTPPAGVQVVEAEGKFVMPGLWDTHAHTRDFDGELNITHGVTSTMDMGNILDWIMVLAEARQKQMAKGPRIFPQGMSIGGNLGQHQWRVETPEHARWAARQNIEAGVSFLKVYREARPEMIKAAVEEARAAGINVHSHLGAVDAREAALLGINALAHGGGIAAATSPPAVAARIKRGEARRDVGTTAVSAYYEQDPAMFDDLIKLLVEHDVRVEPNFVQLFHGIYPQWDQYQVEYHRLHMKPVLYRQIPEIFPRMWSTDYPFDPFPPTPELRQKLEKAYANHQLFMRKFAAAGGKLFVGTDNYYHNAAGIGLWQEMELMGEAGIPALAILQGATIHPAEFVKQDKNLGTIEAGKLADLIILASNPLENIRNIRSIEAVIQHGRIQERGYHADYRNPIPRPYQRVNNSLPRPYIAAVEPSAIPIGAEDLVITVTGENFHEENRVLWNDTELRVLELTPTVLRARVPKELLAAPGTFKVHMITGGRVFAPSLNYGEVMVSFGRRFDQRWNGQTRTKMFEPS